MSEKLNKGLEGVLVAESSLSDIDGDAGRLIYRGYDIEDLARGASYEEVLYLLWNGELPTADQLAAFWDAMAEERAVTDRVIEMLASLADDGETPMAALRTGVSMLSAAEPEPEADVEDMDAARREGRRIVAKIPTLLAAYNRLRRGEEPVDPRTDLSLAGNFLYMLTGEEPSDLAEETFDMALILHADHGLNASTFTAMVIASTRADLYSAVTGGVGALSGPLHGGANQDVMEVLQEVDGSSKDPLQWVQDRIDAGGSVDPGNEVYRAWREMTASLDVESPETTTPREFQRAAVEAGMAREDVSVLTSLFESVRYSGLDPTEETERRAVETLRRIEASYGGE